AYPRGMAYSLAENLLSVVTRWMASIVGRSARRILISIPAWRPTLESLVGRNAAIDWLPVPSSVPVADDPAGVALLRSRIARGKPLVGHLGTYGRLIRPMLESSLTAL